MVKKIISHPLFSGSVIMVGGNMGANAVNYLYHLVMGRVLGPVDYGILASLYSIIYLAGIIPTASSVSIVKFISSSKEEDVYAVYSVIKNFIFRIAVITLLLFIVLSPFITQFLKIEDVWSVVLIGPVIFLILITLVNQASSQGLIRFSGSVIPTLISSAIKFALGILLVLAGFNVFGAVFGIVVGMGLAYLYSAYFIKRILIKGRIKKYNLKPFLKYSLPVLLQALAFTSLFSTDVLLVKHFFDPFSAGLYGALSTLGKIIFFASSPVTATMFPIVSKRKSVGENYQKIFLFAVGIALAISLSITLFYWLFPQIAIGTLYGSAYLSAKNELVWMGTFISFYSLTNLLVNYALSVGDSKIIVFPLLGAIAQIPLIWFWHGSLLMVIQVSLGLTILIFLGTLAYLSYNRLLGLYEK